VFGAAGIVLGPVAAAATIALLDILQNRSGSDSESTRGATRRPSAGG
jgi:hypothetical protein